MHSFFARWNQWRLREHLVEARDHLAVRAGRAAILQMPGATDEFKRASLAVQEAIYILDGPWPDKSLPAVEALSEAHSPQLSTAGSSLPASAPAPCTAADACQSSTGAVAGAECPQCVRMEAAITACGFECELQARQLEREGAMQGAVIIRHFGEALALLAKGEKP